VARLEDVLVEIADYKERRRAWLRYAEQQAEATRLSYRRRLDRLLDGLANASLPAGLLAELGSERLLDAFSPAEIGVLERLRNWNRTSAPSRPRQAPRSG
jgi:hypothetical protein